MIPAPFDSMKEEFAARHLHLKMNFKIENKLEDLPKKYVIR